LEGDAAKTEARSAIERSGGDRAIIDLISTIVVYKFSELSREEVDAMLGIELQHTRVYQEARAEEREIGLQRERGLILRQLDRKLGNVSPQFQSRVSALDIDRLESLGEALLDFNSTTDLEVWLSQN
jgi:predicted transposase YdaD